MILPIPQITLIVLTTSQVPDCSLSDDFGGLFDSSQFADVVLTSGSREFHCHKVRLNCSSILIQ